MSSGAVMESQCLHDSVGPISSSGLDEQVVPAIGLECREAAINEYMTPVPCDNIYTHCAG